MKIKITEEQYNTLLNEGFFDRLGAKVSAGTKQIKAVGSNIKNIVTGDGKRTSYQGIKNLGDETKLKSIGLSVYNFIDNSIKKIVENYPSRNVDVSEYLYLLADFTDQNTKVLNLNTKYIKIPKAQYYTGKNGDNRENLKLKRIGLSINKNIENSIKDLEKLFSSPRRNESVLVEQAYKYMYFLKEFLGANEKMLKLNESSLSKDSNLFFNKKTNQIQPTQTQSTPNQTQPTQGVQNKQTPNQTQPTQTNYPGRTEELRQKMQSKLNPNPYYGK
jgi:hypothetical protein